MYLNRDNLADVINLLHNTPEREFHFGDWSCCIAGLVCKTFHPEQHKTTLEIFALDLGRLWRFRSNPHVQSLATVLEISYEEAMAIACGTWFSCHDSKTLSSCINFLKYLWTKSETVSFLWICQAYQRQSPDRVIDAINHYNRIHSLPLLEIVKPEPTEATANHTMHVRDLSEEELALIWDDTPNDQYASDSASPIQHWPTISVQYLPPLQPHNNGYSIGYNTLSVAHDGVLVFA